MEIHASTESLKGGSPPENLRTFQTKKFASISEGRWKNPRFFGGWVATPNGNQASKK
jgi:hypothetical protein